MKSEEAIVDNSLYYHSLRFHSSQETLGEKRLPSFFGTIGSLFFMKGRARKSLNGRPQEIFYFCNVLESLISASHLFSYHIKLFSGVENGKINMCYY